MSGIREPAKLPPTLLPPPWLIRESPAATMLRSCFLVICGVDGESSAWRDCTIPRDTSASRKHARVGSSHPRGSLNQGQMMVGDGQPPAEYVALCFVCICVCSHGCLVDASSPRVLGCGWVRLRSQPSRGDRWPGEFHIWPSLLIARCFSTLSDSRRI